MGTGLVPSIAPQAGTQHCHGHKYNPAMCNLYPGPVGSEGRSQQSLAGVAGSQGKAQDYWQRKCS